MPLFHPVYVSNSGRVSMRWLPPCDTMGAAAAEGQRMLDEGRATLAFVVREDGDRLAVIPNGTRPQSARKIVWHYIELVAALERGERPTT